MAKLSNDEYITKIYNETYMYIIKFLTIKCSNTEDIQDLLQNTYLEFVKHVQHKGQFYILAPKHYILKISKAQLYKYYAASEFSKKLSLEELREDVENTDYPDDKFLLEDVAESNILNGNIWTSLKTFDDLTVKIFTLKFIHNLSMKEIAKELDIPISTVRNRLYRGIEKLKKISKEEYL